MGQGVSLMISQGKNDMAEKMGQKNRHHGYQGLNPIALADKMHQGKGAGKHSLNRALKHHIPESEYRANKGFGRK